MNSNDIKIPLQYRIRYSEQKNNNTPSLFLLHGFGSNMDDLFALNQFFPMIGPLSAYRRQSQRVLVDGHGQKSILTI